MILSIECVILCILFTLIIMPAQYKDPMVMIMSYPPNVIKRVEQLPQYAGCFKERKKKQYNTHWEKFRLVKTGGTEYENGFDYWNGKIRTSSLP